MCAIIGAVVDIRRQLDSNEANRIVKHIFAKSVERGRDGRGFAVLERPVFGAGEARTYHYNSRSVERHSLDQDMAHSEFFTRYMDECMPLEGASLVGNLRAEPTTEFVRNKATLDQQPYTFGSWNVVHNGTIANDKKLRTMDIPTRIDSAAIVEQLAAIEFTYKSAPAGTFMQMVQKIDGSYAILATHKSHPGCIYVAANYRPVWYARNEQGTFFASSRDYFPDDLTPRMLEPYSAWAFTAHDHNRLDAPVTKPGKGRALVVCSGGLDSVVAASSMIQQGYEIELLHFQYGSRAEGPEYAAIQALANVLNVKLHIRDMNIYNKWDSPLLNPNCIIAGGEAGAEFAYEWVPARNLVMLAMATAMAEAMRFDTIVLGNNLEEAGAYPDNEPEFIQRFNDLLPFAVGIDKRVRVVMPVGNLMKHEIVALGNQIGAPMHLTWSCYKKGPLHCGKCGPCYMRRTAFDINDLPEVIQYASQEK